MRVHHDCDFPKCPLFGIIISVMQYRSHTTDGREFDEWAIVEWDAHQGATPKATIPAGTRSIIPTERLVIVND